MKITNLCYHTRSHHNSLMRGRVVLVTRNQVGVQGLYITRQRNGDETKPAKGQRKGK